ncbi:MAG: hypothetical protein Q9168_005970 [Polycauliona sp. 1 TL-2023]
MARDHEKHKAEKKPVEHFGPKTQTPECDVQVPAGDTETRRVEGSESSSSESNHSPNPLFDDPDPYFQDPILPDEQAVAELVAAELAAAELAAAQLARPSQASTSASSMEAGRNARPEITSQHERSKWNEERRQSLVPSQAELERRYREVHPEDTEFEKRNCKKHKERQPKTKDKLGLTKLTSSSCGYSGPLAGKSKKDDDDGDDGSRVPKETGYQIGMKSIREREGSQK